MAIMMTLAMEEEWVAGVLVLATEEDMVWAFVMDVDLALVEGEVLVGLDSITWEKVRLSL